MSVDVAFITRDGCGLCETAERTVREVVDATDASLRVLDVDADEDLRARYDWDVPVVLVDGRQHSFHRDDAQRLTRAVEAARARAQSGEAAAQSAGAQADDAASADEESAQAGETRTRSI